MGYRLRPYNQGEIALIESLIREGEARYGKSEAQGHLVQDYVQREMIGRGLRVKIHPRDSKLPIGKKYKCNGEQPDVIIN